MTATKNPIKTFLVEINRALAPSGPKVSQKQLAVAAGRNQSVVSLWSREARDPASKYPGQLANRKRLYDGAKRLCKQFGLPLFFASALTEVQWARFKETRGDRRKLPRRKLPRRRTRASAA